MHKNPQSNYNNLTILCINKLILASITKLILASINKLSSGASFFFFNIKRKVTLLSTR